MTDLANDRFARGCGIALICAGVLTIVINVWLTPVLRAGHYPPEIAPTTTVYLLRQSLSGVAALLLIFGSLGVHLVLRQAAGAFGFVAFLTAFIGGCMLFAVEFTGVFVLPAIAAANRDAYLAIDKDPIMTIGFISAAGLFALGWLLLSIATWRSRLFPRSASIATFAGLFLISLLQAPFGFAGAIAGNVIFGLGLIGLGRAVISRGPPAV